MVYFEYQVYQLFLKLIVHYHGRCHLNYEF